MCGTINFALLSESSNNKDIEMGHRETLGGNPRGRQFAVDMEIAGDNLQVLRWMLLRKLEESLPVQSLLFGS